MQILIVGASGGIGLAILKAMLDAYPDAFISATYYNAEITFNHARVRWFKCDVRVPEEIEVLSHNFESVDLLVNAVGFLHSEVAGPEKSIRDFSHTFLSENLSINTVPSIFLAKYFEAALKKSKRNTFFVVLSARIGSIKDNRVGGWISYRIAKAALNMAMKTVGIEWRRKLPNCCVLLFHPGTTDTELSKPFQKNLAEHQLHSPEFTANALLSLMGSLSPADSGKFVGFDGVEIEW